MHARSRRIRTQPAKFAGSRIARERVSGVPGIEFNFRGPRRFAKASGFLRGDVTGRTKYKCPSLEAQIANLADEITYYSHDLDDAVDFEILNGEQLEQNLV